LTSARRVGAHSHRTASWVDTDRPTDLPVPSVSLPKSTKQPPPARQPSPPASDPTPPVLQQQPSEQQATRSRLSMRKQSFGDPEADPWGSPDMHKGHNHASYTAVPPQTNGANAPSTTRTTSQFTTNSTSNSTSNQDIRPSSLGSEGGWGGYNGGGNQPFAAPGLGEEGFGAAPVGGGSNPPPELGRSIGRLGPSGTGSEEVITITTILEKEGVFLFQHRNYEVASSRRTTKVIRRYSDFVWLLDCLHKRYPFRQLPLLPPKRVGSKFPFPNGLTRIEVS
jgi:sorting nexin-8